MLARLRSAAAAVSLVLGNRWLIGVCAVLGCVFAYVTSDALNGFLAGWLLRETLDVFAMRPLTEKRIAIRDEYIALVEKDRDRLRHMADCAGSIIAGKAEAAKEHLEQADALLAELEKLTAKEAA